MSTTDITAALGTGLTVAGLYLLAGLPLTLLVVGLILLALSVRFATAEPADE